MEIYVETKSGQVFKVALSTESHKPKTLEVTEQNKDENFKVFTTSNPAKHTICA